LGRRCPEELLSNKPQSPQEFPFGHTRIRHGQNSIGISQPSEEMDGSAVSFHGMETHIYQKTHETWCLVHVHYSAPTEKKAGTE
jgi:hypothetical protein